MQEPFVFADLISETVSRQVIDEPLAEVLAGIFVAHIIKCESVANVLRAVLPIYGSIVCLLTRFGIKTNRMA